jgi:hypothetical protein
VDHSCYKQQGINPGGQAMSIALIAVILLLMSVPLFTILRARRARSNNSAEWQPYIRYSWTLVSLVDGTATRSLYLMRRNGPDGNWQFRKMTIEEFYRQVNWMS